MRIQSGLVWLDLAAELVDEMLLEASRSASAAERDQFVKDREALASIETIDIREDAFRSFDAEWVDRFGVLEPLRSLLSSEKQQSWVLRRAKTNAEERVRVSRDDGEHLVYLDVQPKTMLSRDGLERLLTGARRQG